MYDFLKVLASLGGYGALAMPVVAFISALKGRPMYFVTLSLLTCTAVCLLWVLWQKNSSELFNKGDPKFGAAVLGTALMYVCFQIASIVIYVFTRFIRSWLMIRKGQSSPK
jgi:hypothetical protein